MDAQYAAAYPKLYSSHWWWRVREEIVLRKIRRLLTGVDRPRILDVGCGAALFFDALQHFGQVYGIESNPAAVDNSGRWRSRIVLGELDESYRPDAPFDLILILDVIEHVPDSADLLRRAAAFLAPRGRILVTVPAFNALWTRHDDMNHHVTRYTSSMLRQTLERAGLVAVETEYMFQSLVVPKLLVRLREALIDGPARVPRVPPAAINRAIQGWFRVEHALAGWLPFGGSLLAVAALRDPFKD